MFILLCVLITIVFVYVYTAHIGTLLITDSRLPYNSIINCANAILAESVRRENESNKTNCTWRQYLTGRQIRDNIRTNNTIANIKSKAEIVTRSLITLKNINRQTPTAELLHDISVKEKQLASLNIVVRDIQKDLHVEPVYRRSVYLAIGKKESGNMILSTILNIIKDFNNFDISLDPMEYSMLYKPLHPWHTGWHTSGSEITKWMNIYMIQSWTSSFIAMLMILLPDARTLGSTVIPVQLMHALASWYIYNSFLNKVIEGGAWSLLQRSDVMVVRSDCKSYDLVHPISISKASQSFESRTYGYEPGHDSENDDETKRHKQASNQLKDTSKALRKIAVAGSKAAAEKSRIIPFVYLAIVFHTYIFKDSFSYWENLSLLSVLVVICMGSIHDALTCNTIFEKILYLKETLISQNHRAWYEKKKPEYYPFSFACNTIKLSNRRYTLSSFTLPEIYDLIKAVLLGPATQMIPDSLRDTTEHKLNFAGVKVILRVGKLHESV